MSKKKGKVCENVIFMLPLYNESKASYNIQKLFQQFLCRSKHKSAG